MTHQNIIEGLAWIGGVSLALIGTWIAFCLAAWCENWLMRREMLTDHANSARREIEAIWKRVEMIEGRTAKLEDKKTD